MFAGIFLLITLAGIFIALRIEFLIGHLSFLEKMAVFLLNVIYVSIITYLFSHNGSIESHRWFRKYVLTGFLFLALLLYNIMNIIEMIGKIRGVINTPLLSGTSLVSLFFVIPLLILLYILSIASEMKYLSRKDISERFLRVGLVIFAAFILGLGVIKILR